MKYLLQLFSFYILKTFTVRFFLIISFTTINLQVLGQFLDDFSDGDFTNNLSWQGSDSKFIIESNMLRLNAPALKETAYLVTVHNLQPGNLSWDFWVRLNFNPSSSNYARIYLMSDQADLNGPLNGYFVMLGNTTDEISLYRQSGTTKTKIIDGTNATLNAASKNARIRITRDANGFWQLLSDVDVTGSFTVEGEVADQTHVESHYFGVFCAYTATRSNKFYFDNFTVSSTPIADIEAPVLHTIEIVSSTEIDLHFSEILDRTSSELVAHYAVDNHVGAPLQATLLTNEKIVRLTFLHEFPNGLTCTLTASNVKDVAGNVMTTSTNTFSFFQPVAPTKNDIIITEFFADPSPARELPEAEFVEIFNASAHPFDLTGWKLTDNKTTGVLTAHLLLPGAYLILTTTTSASKFTGYGNVMGVPGFPSLNNTEDIILLMDNNNNTIDSLTYSDLWYNDIEKAEGGWSIERISYSNYCNERDNWMASIANTGGTPGQQNSIFFDTPDTSGVRLMKAEVTSLDTITLHFNKNLEHDLPSLASFSIQPPLAINAIKFASEHRQIITLATSLLQEGTLYSVYVTNVRDCSGNVIQAGFDETTFTLAVEPLRLDSIVILSATELNLIFNKTLDEASTLVTSNYWVDNGIASPSTVTLGNDQRTIKLIFNNSFPNGINCNVTVSNLKDASGNVIATINKPFLYFRSEPIHSKDVIISEIFADPSPIISLPDVEYIEIFNRSNNPIDLQGWTLSDGGNVRATLKSFLLLSHQHLILTSGAGAQLFGAGLNVMSLSNFPSLNNEGDQIVLKTKSGSTIDSVRYSIGWYNDSEKELGGWSLELIDPNNVCSEEENWAASNDNKGGTPGQENSILASKPDVTGPIFLSALLIAPDTILLTFNEKLDNVVPSIDHFSIEPPLALHHINFSNSSLKQLHLINDIALPQTLYSIEVKKLYDCNRNLIQADFNTVQFALPETADSLDIVINEILFNPRSTGVDFVEIINSSEKFISLKNWSIGNYVDNKIENIKTLSTAYLMHPNTYLAFTPDANLLKGEYLQGEEKNFIETELPPLPDDEGTIALIDDHGQIIDHFSYRKNMHSVFIKDEEGVSLERINTKLSTDENMNWKSASSTVGFATPGYVNSNSRVETIVDENVVVEPEIFIPITGQPDFTQIKYNFEQGGLVANIKVFDAQGRLVKRLANNEILAKNGFFRWDGDNEDGTKARIGYYMIWFDVLDPTGSVKTIRKRVAIAGNF